MIESRAGFSNFKSLSLEFLFLGETPARKASRQ
jgi:hypothetical protein